MSNRGEMFLIGTALSFTAIAWGFIFIIGLLNLVDGWLGILFPLTLLGGIFAFYYFRHLLNLSIIGSDNEENNPRAPR